MFEALCSPRSVKECFLLANALKTGPFDPESYRAKAGLERRRLAEISDTQIDQQVTDGYRRRRYNHATWLLTVVDLASCSVWNPMGQRNWATGPVSQVAERLKTLGDSTDRLWDMTQFIQQPFSEVPIIVFERKSNCRQFRIDDGCHRAVAYYLAGFRQAFAIVGKVDPKYNLDWRWEGD
jgi:hypothetical protein